VLNISSSKEVCSFFNRKVTPFEDRLSLIRFADSPTACTLGLSDIIGCRCRADGEIFGCQIDL
jgi:hypothetical protein